MIYLFVSNTSPSFSLVVDCVYTAESCGVLSELHSFYYMLGHSNCHGIVDTVSAELIASMETREQTRPDEEPNKVT
jgi:hypothetical protein